MLNSKKVGIYPEALRKRSDTLEAAVAHLKMQTDRLQTLENGLSAPTPETSRPKGKQHPGAR